MAYALWSNLPYNVGAPGVNFSYDQKTVFFAGNYVIGAVCLLGITSGKNSWCAQFNAAPDYGDAGIDLGFADSTGLGITSLAENCLVVQPNGNVILVTAGSAAELFTIPNITATSWLMFCADQTGQATLIGAEYEGVVTFYGNGGAPFTKPEVEAGSATGIATSNVAALNPYAWLYYGTGSAFIEGNPANYPFAAPGNYPPLPPSLQATSITTVAGSPTEVEWVSNEPVGTLYYSLNGGAPTPCGGSTISGTGGTATINTTSAGEIDQIVLSDHGNVLAVGPTMIAFAGGNTALDGPQIISLGGIFTNENPPGNTSTQAGTPYSTGAANGGFLYEGDTSASTIVFSTSVIGSLAFGSAASLNICDTSTHTILGQNFSNAGTSTPIASVGYSIGLSADGLDVPGFSETIGGNSVSARGTIIIAGTLVSLTCSINGTAFAQNGTLPPETAGAISNVIVLDGFSPAHTDWSYGVEINGPPPPETLTLAFAEITGTGAGTLSIGGVVGNADLTLVDYATDGGETWQAASNLVVDGGTWSASGGALSYGPYDVIARDGVTGLETNEIGLNVVPQGQAMMVMMLS
jgi:hypothetical protein